MEKRELVIFPFYIYGRKNISFEPSNKIPVYTKTSRAYGAYTYYLLNLKNYQKK
jgi:hypothetical protein